MKKLLSYIFFFFLLSSFSIGDNEYRRWKNSSFGRGEELQYRVHYGIINAGVATMKVDEDIHYVNGRPCYKIDVYGKTVGVFDFFTKIRDNWGAYVDTAAILPQQGYRNIEEGRYRKYEVSTFDHRNDTVEMSWLDNETKKVKERKQFEVPNEVLDLVSGYYYLRTLDFSRYKVGDVISIDAFFDEEVYDFKIRYTDKQKLKTAVGEINSIVLTPIIPKNKLFNGENAIQVWISDDSNRIPLKIKANMFVGAVEIDITGYSNTRN